MPITGKLRVLQVEDSESDAELIVRTLERSGYVVEAERVDDEGQMRQALSRHEWDVVISDYQLPRFSTAEALQILSERSLDVPFIVVSGAIGEDCAVDLMRAGAKDYILKDRLGRLVPAVQRETGQWQSRHELRRAEDRLRENDAWLSRAVSATHLGFFDFYPQTGKFVASDGLIVHAGLPPGAELSYEQFLGGIHPEDRERVSGVRLRSFDPAGGGEYTADHRMIGLADKVERWLAVEGRVSFSADGKPMRFVGVTIEITARKKLEDQFRQSQKLECIGQLAGGVAHDFNNLLTVIAGYSQMTLGELPDDDPLRSNIEEVLKASVRAADLTRQLLAFSRRQPSHTEALVLNDLVMNVQNMLKRLIGEDVKLTLSLDPAAGSIRADAGQIEQVIMNLVVNARDAMPNGGQLVIGTALRVIEARPGESQPDQAPGPVCGPHRK